MHTARGLITNVKVQVLFVTLCVAVIVVEYNDVDAAVKYPVMLSNVT